MNIRCREQGRKSDIGLKISVNSLLIIWEKVNRMNDLISRQAAIDALHMHLGTPRRLSGGMPTRSPKRW